MRNPKLEPWLIEGIKRVANGGVSSLRVAEMAEEINIGKSSFYHYFTTKEEYLEQLVEYWIEEGTIRIMKKFLLIPTQKQPVFSLIKFVFETNFVNECVLQQFRIARIKYPEISQKLDEVDKFRINFMSTLINRQGYSWVEAEKKGTQAYKYFLGVLALRNLVPPSKEEIKAIMDDYKDVIGEI